MLRSRARVRGTESLSAHAHQNFSLDENAPTAYTDAIPHQCVVTIYLKTNPWREHPPAISLYRVCVVATPGTSIARGVSHGGDVASSAVAATRKNHTIVVVTLSNYNGENSCGHEVRVCVCVGPKKIKRNHKKKRQKKKKKKRARFPGRSHLGDFHFFFFFFSSQMILIPRRRTWQAPPQTNPKQIYTWDTYQQLCPPRITDLPGPVPAARGGSTPSSMRRPRARRPSAPTRAPRATRAMPEAAGRSHVHHWHHCHRHCHCH
jgi:hypothetical protein